jgi:hemoglobin-like flavoprotein
MNQNEINMRLYHESLTRVIHTVPKFLDIFYYHFMNSSSDIAQLFHSHNMERIKRKLMTTLELVGDNADNIPGTEMYLEMLGRIHERRQVKLEHFKCWKTALINTIAECDPAFNQTTLAAWHSILDSIMLKMYGNVVNEYPNYRPIPTQDGGHISNIGQRL